MGITLTGAAAVAAASTLAAQREQDRRRLLGTAGGALPTRRPRGAGRPRG